jgi:hypothetical protein
MWGQKPPHNFFLSFIVYKEVIHMKDQTIILTSNDLVKKPEHVRTSEIVAGNSAQLFCEKIKKLLHV